MRMLRVLGIMLVATLMGFQAHSKDLSSRLGVGFRDAFPFSLPAIALHYNPNADVGLVGALGVDTEDQNSKFGLQIGIHKTIFKEDNLNFFAGGNFSLLTQEVAGNKKTGYELSAIVGTEFFFTGLDNLGLNMETGFAVTSLDKVRFRTLADHILRAGMTFYF